jgi:hypothetical protein
MKFLPAIGIRSVLAPLVTAVAVAVGIAVVVPTYENGAGLLGIMAILLGAMLVAAAALLALHWETAQEPAPVASNRVAVGAGEARATGGKAAFGGVGIERGLSPRYVGAAAAMTVTFVTLAPGVSFEKEAPNQAESRHPGKAASETLARGAGERAAS